MTTEPSAQTTTMQWARKICLDHGLRVSKARCQLLGVLSGAHDHPTAEGIFSRLKATDPRANISSAYRNLRTFEKAGILDRLELGDGRMRYEFATSRQHEHLVDVQFGLIVEVRAPEIEKPLASVASKLGYRLAGYRLRLFGAPARFKWDPEQITGSSRKRVDQIPAFPWRSQ